MRAATAWHRPLDHFGAPDEESLDGGELWPSGERLKGGHHRWRRDPATLDADLAYLIAGEPWPKGHSGPVTLRVSYQFRWREAFLVPFGVVDHPQFEKLGGSFRLWFDRRCFVQPLFTIPFVYDDPRLLDFLKGLAEYLPFRMHPKHFARCVRNKRGEYVVRRLPFRLVLA